MTVKRRRKTSKKNEWALSKFVKEYIITYQTLPIISILSILGVFFVLIRMKGVEQDYQLNDITKRIQIHKTQNKELKADLARALSVKRLKGFAKKFNLKEPNENHIIIIHEN